MFFRTQFFSKIINDNIAFGTLAHELTMDNAELNQMIAANLEKIGFGME